MRRRDVQEDFWICYSALPAYQCHLGKRAPTYKKLTAHRQKRQQVEAVNDEAYWQNLIKEANDA